MADINYPIANKEEVTSQLADKVQNFKLKNEVVNGDFSQGLTNYIFSGIKIGGVTTSSNELTVVSNSQFTYATYNFPFVSGRKYYIAIDALVDTGATAISDIRLYTNPNNELLSTKVNPQPGVWISSSGVAIINTGTNIRFGTLYSSITSDRVSKYRRFKCVDLTATFGAGNEPTKEEMDRLVEMLPNQWWDGELDLTQQQYVNWLLSFTREKANKKQEAWITPTLLNGWYPDPTFAKLQYLKDDFGFVHIKGCAKRDASTGNSKIFDLISGYRPESIYPSIFGGNFGSGTFIAGAINAEGGVLMYGNGLFVSIDLIFKAV